MIIKKEINNENEFYLYFNGKLIFKKWLDQGHSKVFDHSAWDKYTRKSITDFDLDEAPGFYEVECNLNLFSKEKGGRETPIASGYRPDHVFEYENDGSIKYAFVGDFQFGENKIIEPGTTQEAVARFLTHQPIEQYLNIGQEWWIHEGKNKIGVAEMLRIKSSEKE